MKDFEEVLQDVFGPRSLEFSPDLLARLQRMRLEGIKVGLYLEREQLPVPPEVFEVWERSETLPSDPRRVPGRFGELGEAKQVLLDLVETLGLEIDHCLRPERTLGVTGEDLARARNQFFIRVQSLMRVVAKATTSVQEML